jgi:hypothetical protein
VSLSEFHTIEMSPESNTPTLRLIAIVCLAIGSVLGMAGAFVPSAELRAILWNIDGTALVVAAAALAVIFFKRGEDLAAAGYIVFAVAEGVIMTSNGVSALAGAPQFASGTSLWAAALVMISSARIYPMLVRILGFAAAGLFAISSFSALAGYPVNAMSSPLPFFAYPVFVGTMIGWIWTLLRMRTTAAAG